MRDIVLATAILVCGIGLATKAACSDLSSLPAGQQQAAECMLAVVSREPGVTFASLRLVDENNDAGQVFLDYTYRSRNLPRADFQHLDVTDLISTGHEGIVVSGIGGTAPLNELDDDLFAIAEHLKAKCGLILDLVTE